MKTPVVIGVVVALHCVALGTLLMTQGCGTAKGTSGPVQFVDKPAVLPKPETKDVMPPKLAKPHVKPAMDVEDDIFSKPPAPVKKEVKKDIKPAVEATKSYTIKSGDSMGYIAQRFKISISEIKELNPSIKDISKIREGQTIKLPSYVNLSAPAPKRHTKPKPVKAAEPKASGPSAPAPAFDSAPVASGGEYVIVSGDYPEKIAKKLGVKMDDLISANKITDPKKLKIGQKLVIPGAAAAPAPSPFPMAPVDPAPFAPMTGFDSTSAVPAGMAPMAPTAPAMGPAPAPGMTPPAAPMAPMAPVAPAAPGMAAPVAPAAGLPVMKPVAQKHLVAPGETLKDIAMLYTVTVADIMRANNMTSEAVAPGQSLNIPPAQ